MKLIMFFLFIFGLFGLPSPALSAWNNSEIVDRLDGSKTMTVMTTARETIYQPYRQSKEMNNFANAAFYCDDKGLSFVIILNGKLIASEDTPVGFRIDNSPAVKGQFWNGSTDNTAVGLWNSPAAKKMLSRLLNGKEMFFRIEHRVFGITEAYFDLTGLSDAVKDWPRKCR